MRTSRSRSSSPAAATVQVYPDQRWQIMEGFGVGLHIHWNLMLDETGCSSWGWVQNALISIDRNTGQVRYNPEFY